MCVTFTKVGQGHPSYRWYNASIAPTSAANDRRHVAPPKI